MNLDAKPAASRLTTSDPRNGLPPSGPVRIQPLVPEDIDRCVELAMRVYGTGPGDRQERFGRDVIGEESQMFVARVSQAIVGYGRVAKLLEYEAGPGTPAGYYLSGVLVDPAWRRQGIASALTRARLRWVFKRSAEVFYVTESTNEASLGLHFALGFTTVEHLPSLRPATEERTLARLVAQDAYPDVRPDEAGSVPPLVPDDFIIPTGLSTDDFRLEPLGPAHNLADYAAWTSSIELIQQTPGFIGRSWPGRVEAPDANLASIEIHVLDFARRIGFAYTVLVDDDVVGCVYIYPPRRAGYDADVRSWVRASHEHLDGPLYHAVSAWLRDTWPFSAVDYAPRP